MRVWDRMGADRVDYFIANSKTVAERIKHYYRRESTVIYPPVNTQHFCVREGEKTYYLAGGRLVDYKRIDLAISACNELGVPLKIFGDGPELERLKELAGETVEFVGRITEEEKYRLFEDAIAFLHPQEEDFGMTAVESMASGRPVIAYAKGGATETVIPGLSGILFEEQSIAGLVQAIKAQQATSFDPIAISKHAEQFSTEVFHQKIHAFIQSVWSKHQ